MTSHRREPLHRDRILETAIALADRDGVEALSMRKLATELGYEVMSLYNHVENKNDLLDGMVDLVAAEIEEPDADLTWREAVRHVAVSAHEALTRHRWAARLWGERWPGPHRWRHMETLLRLLAGAGLPDDVADLGFHAVNNHVEGYTQQQIAYAAVDQDAMYARFESEVTGDVYPELVAHVQYHLDRTTSHDDFAFVLDLILDGLERLASSASAGPPD